MNAKTVVFDFNGTLFFDFYENEEAWKECYLHFAGVSMPEGEFQRFAGRTDSACSKMIIPDASPSLIEEMINYKESVYKDICLAKNLSLAPGAEEFLNMLKARNLTLAIGSSAPTINFDWYIPHYNLTRWFPLDLIVYGMEKLPSKPAPDIYEYVLKRAEANSDEAICFEDAYNGILAAKAAGFNRVFAIDSPGIDTSTTRKLAPLVDYSYCISHIAELLELQPMC